MDWFPSGNSKILWDSHTTHPALMRSILDLPTPNYHPQGETFKKDLNIFVWHLNLVHHCIPWAHCWAVNRCFVEWMREYVSEWLNVWVNACTCTSGKLHYSWIFISGFNCIELVFVHHATREVAGRSLKSYQSGGLEEGQAGERLFP